VRLSPTRLQAIDRAFDEALDLTPPERSAFLTRLAVTDAALAAAVGALLRAADGSDPRLEGVSPAAGLFALHEELSGAHELSPGDEIGRFRILRELGRGGMAVVYLAERADGAFEQMVAIKRLHHGLGTLGALQRFHQERQILATLNHASIATLLDGGVDGSGFPYLVMEYVEGTPIDRYADDHTLTVRARLDLFTRVARAVDYAHRNLVVHRDIKPSNILVTPDGEVKLLDFGIAKLVDSPTGAEPAPVTQTVLRALTPEYASPEQLNGTRITIASDVYQLGLLLYELITGVRARQIESGSLIEAAVACAQPVTRPSVMVGMTTRRDEIARARATSPIALARLLRGDLDNIVAMAVHAQPEARYPTAAALADDVIRHVSGRAVRARGEAPLYRAMRFVQRHALGITASAAIVGLLVAVAITASIQAARIAEERDRVRVEAAKAQGVTQFLLGLFEIPPTAEANYANLSAREVLEYRAARVDELAEQPPIVQAEIMSTVGYALIRLASHDRGIALIQRSLETRREQLGLEHVDTAESLHRLGTGLNMKGDFAAAEPHLRQALAIRERLLGRAHVEVAETLTELARAVGRLGRLDDAEQMLIRALAIDRAAGNDYQARVLNTLGLLEVARGNDDAASKYFGEAIAYRRARFGNNHSDLATNLLNLAQVHLRQKKPHDAIPLLEESIVGRRRVFGDTHLYTAAVRLVLASAYIDAAEFTSAEQLLQEVDRTRDPKNVELEQAVARQFESLYERSGRRRDARRIPPSTQDRD
jgi:tetratricopeptide (TPR) repeat protein